MIYSMVVSLALVSALRCFLAILLYLWHPEHYIADTLVWSCGHLIMLTIELTIGVLVMTGAKLDTVTHCRTVVIGSGLVSVIVTSIKLYYELTHPYYGYQVRWLLSALVIFHLLFSIHLPLARSWKLAFNCMELEDQRQRP